MARTTEFNREEVLENAMNTFWQKGYSQTSIPNLVEMTKLNPGSIYAAFDSKEGLFLETLDFYGNRSLLSLKQHITNADSPLTGIKSFFQVLINTSADDSQRGCLLVNTLLEMSSHNVTIQTKANKQLKMVETELFTALQNAQNLGELSSNSNPETLAKYLMLNIWGIRVLAKTGTMKNHSHARDDLLEQVLSALNK